MKTRLTRREIVAAGMTIAGAAIARSVYAAPSSPAAGGVSANETLMNEHGVFARCLLIYEEGVRRIRNAEEDPSDVFYKTSLVIDSLIHQHHEPSEEQYLFPAFEHAGKLADLIAVLKDQHATGQSLSTQILPLAKPDQFKYPNDQQKLAALADQFIRLYRPHTAREDTVLYPALRTLLSPAQIIAIGEQIEANGNKVLGAGYFDKAVADVTAIEKELGIYDLAQFSQPAPSE